jgi:hypothetical protein
MLGAWPDTENDYSLTCNSQEGKRKGGWATPAHLSQPKYPAAEFSPCSRKGAGALKKVFILTRNTMFGRGIESLIAQSGDLEICCPEQYTGTTLDCILEYHPDVLIVNCDEPTDDLSSAVACLLQKRLDVRIIGLSLKDNRICICQGEAKEVRQVDDLLRAIQD